MGGGGTGGAGGAGGEFMLVLQWLIKPGTFVKKGTVVAEFDRQYMLQRLEDFRASLAQTEASLIKLKAEIDVGRKAHQQTIATAKAELDKARLDLKTTPVLGAIEAERLRLAAEEAEAKYKQLLSEVPLMETKFRATIRAAELEVQQMRLELRRAEMNAERMVVKAPIDGITVMQSTFRGGELAPVQQGDQLFPGSIFMHIVDPRSMLINAVLNQVDADQVRVGARARVRFDAYPGMELPAHVYSIGAMTRPGGFRANYVREIPVQLKLDRMDPRVIPDLAVSVDVVIETEQQAAAVTPRSAIFTGENGKPFVFVKQGEEFEERPVELGVRNNIVAAIRSGLRVGEEVAAEMPPRERIKGKGSS
jgi:multidrug resistance efflux pump